MNNPSQDPDEIARDRIGARESSPPPETGLYVVATPIGNLRDITLRALDILGGVNRVYAEDTRVARKLMDAYGLKPRLAAYHEHNAEAAREEILDALGRGESVALISDAGTPLVSDPGFKLARAVIEAGHRVFPIPGASASLAALVVSGLPSDRFLFAGFLPNKQGARKATLTELADIDATLILYESGPRLAESLADMVEVLGARSAAVARELTKMFEETRRDTLDALAAHYAEAGGPRGEIVVVIGPPHAKGEVSEEALDAFLLKALPRGVKDAAAEAARDLGVPRKRAYQRALELKDRA
ncbi:16S rRNA (cytidine(1402)-2'-O)-methyltransferase [Vitreimonas flagellata]|uniref:16S rRNA (cytidine(1402)-2'-O)-methyltransferase n=1 Tax=Vitreimonas flagellata TaxID=2560861 RepID=UPI00107507C7|nr:16S rRNA (cytidine(1402)-2'-O)-methyltransferase [Vitreimonas flagellata]